MSRPEADLSGLARATDALLATVPGLDQAALTAPSRLPGWSRGHVLAHLARNADALVNVMEGRPMYADAGTRDRDIEAGAGRAPSDQLVDLRAAADRLRDAFDARPDNAWGATVALRNGVTDSASGVPFRRWLEVELHHVDLGVDRDVSDFSGAFTDRALGYLTRRYQGNAAVPPVEVRAEDGRSWPTGGTEGPALVVAGNPAALVGWLSGRTTGSGLTATGAPLPVLPPL
ncbi:maleylpyruvate isomerase family mycothiol-dependent enzyme [Streptomyces spiramenti]|uniref:Maleylpyruvate isomerase family mycothiol-dependent enzyme n=1 Tax=Streptomyces spiramenti TaxID=2720606 RepID=A0ABX1AM63_9ACTN|nr:maleylpyruvate isomerase family mycothiol-dependent enzyme [Streptomyces spiramenti]NJP67345.1 maleylpyruvate isomerase family mycothiol-dependent enzyme [Streptomyces spiramenti]